MGDLYDADVLEWSEHQARLLRQQAAGEPGNEAPDWANIIEEVESVGRSQLAAIIHQLEAILCRERLFSRDGCAGVRTRCHLGSDMRSARHGGVRGWWKWVTAGHAAPLFS